MCNFIQFACLEDILIWMLCKIKVLEILFLTDKHAKVGADKIICMYSKFNEQI